MERGEEGGGRKGGRQKKEKTFLINLITGVRNGIPPLRFKNKGRQEIKTKQKRLQQLLQGS